MAAVDASSFRKLTHREHVLLRPEMYIGSVAVESCAAWVLGEEDSNGVGGIRRMERKEGLAYSPGLLKVFDEIVVNAIDHATRTRSQQQQQQQQQQQGGGGKTKKRKAADSAAAEAVDDSSSMASSSTLDDAPQLVKNIRVSIDQATGIIEVSNDGDGIPVEKHAQEGVYVPELIFGHLLTSANYDDEKQAPRVVGGQNGIGAKACNIMSEWFEIEVIDRVRHLRFRQKFERNMEVAGTPHVGKCDAKKSSLTVRFLPDYKRLGMADGKLSDDMAALMRRRVWDATALTDPDVAVWLDNNKKKLEVKSFERYVDLYVGGKGEAQRAYEKPCDGWEIAAALSPDGMAQQVSFVNGVATLRGGKHVDHVLSQISKKLCELVMNKKKMTTKPQYIKDNLMVFVRATVPNPKFDSQSKETLTTPVSQFGGKVEVSNAFVEKLYKMDGLVDRIISLSGAAIDKEARKTDGSKKSTISVPKLDDAALAGTNKSDQCTLILTEGDSAKASAIAGLSVVGREKWGVFPLRGKVINPSDLSADKIAANAEVTALKQILGLQVGKKYTTTSELRYGRILLLTDADVDGTHIRGLLINLFLHLWPELLKINGFICTMLTPVIKVYPSGTVRKGKSIDFYNQSDYDAWKEKQTLTVKKKLPPSIYLKGLGSSGSEDAKDWFRNRRIVAYIWDDADSKEALMKSFDKKRADDRKAWLSQYDAKKTLDYGADDVGYVDFVERDLVHFSIYDLSRSIPSVVDGLKVSQRKALFACRKRNLYKGEVRVAQLAAYAAEVSMYHHGETSMQGTLISMAQDFVGSGNNCPLLVPIGQFGTRLMGGEDSASPRYIHTRLSKLAALIFPKEDDAILEYLDDDGHPVEPKCFLPIVPLVLLNGASGIGTGFSTHVPSYNPLEVVEAVRAWMKQRSEGIAAAAAQIEPWHRGFTGVIEEVVAGGDKLRSRGILTRVANTPKVKVTELPLGCWTETFKEALEALVEKNADVKLFVNESSDMTVNFTITFASAAAADAWMTVATSGASAGVTKLETELKIVTTKGLSSTNMHLFDAESRIKKYASPSDIVDAFCVRRLEGYAKRKEVVLRRLRAEAALLKNKVLFLELVCDGRLVLHGKRDVVDGDDGDDGDGGEKALETEMESLGLERMAEGGDKNKKKAASINENENENEDEEEENAAVDEGGGFKYLLGMPMASLTHRRKEALNAQLYGKNAEISSVEEKEPEDMWADDLDALTAELKLVLSRGA